MSTTSDVTFAKGGVLDCIVNESTLVVHPELIYLTKYNHGNITAHITQQWNDQIIKLSLEKVSDQYLCYKIKSTYSIRITSRIEELLRSNSLSVVFRIYDDNTEIYKQVLILRCLEENKPLAPKTPDQLSQKQHRTTALKTGASNTAASSPKSSEAMNISEIIIPTTNPTTSTSTSTTNPTTTTSTPNTNKRKAQHDNNSNNNSNSDDNTLNGTENSPNNTKLLDEKNNLILSLIDTFQKRRLAANEQDKIRLLQIQARLDSNVTIPTTEVLSMELEVIRMHNTMKQDEKLRTAMEEELTKNNGT